MKMRLKINGILLAASFMLIILFPAVFLRKSSVAPWDASVEMLGMALIIFGQILRASSRGYKSERSLNGHLLISSGPYALVRNPMYLGIFLIGLGIVLMLFNWWVTLVFLCVFIWRYTSLIFKEERKLLLMFPSAYPEYAKKVPRLFPSFASIFKKDIAGILPLKLPWLKKETGPILVILFIVIFLESREDLKTIGIKIYARESLLFLAVITFFVFLSFYLIDRTNSQQKDASNKGKADL
ncbi:MAG: isoprenylcysteine carboxylmethyltransferase family protein [Candidatus Omnitrophica bacterium]|nr:isoprenylcysteine carboxylmethyltransferase family protein [Candidatus Omnitrophota bacterium]MDD5552453.1 isoprenylcysteine carboxylmethyltransferase family protein [Candidatus Omnitrophota bacterium]